VQLQLHPGVHPAAARSRTGDALDHIARVEVEPAQIQRRQLGGWRNVRAERKQHPSEPSLLMYCTAENGCACGECNRYRSPFGLRCGLAGRAARLARTGAQPKDRRRTELWCAGLRAAAGFDERRYQRPAIGGGPFLLSDLLLASRLFRDAHFEQIGDVVWLTYIAGQGLIVEGTGLPNDRG
jgi:YhhN family